MNERYRLVRPLAAGGMAELFLGVARAAEGLERTVAIKRMLPHLAQEPDIARMFLTEARLATQLQHQNIATVYDVGQGPAGLFLVMELVDGWDLGVLLRAAARQGRRFPPHLAAFVVLQALSGLIHAYRKVHNGRPLLAAHRDVSPSNILVSREGEVKVTDFGIARMEGVSVTEPGIFKGKMEYSAPEVLQGAPATAASDQFSLGIVFHELLTGQHPFSAPAEPLAVAYAIMNRDVPPPQDVPAPLASIVLRMLARAPESRFARAEELAELLARWLARTGEPASSAALAAFLQELRIPPTLRERAEADGDDALPVEPGLPTRPVAPRTFALEDGAVPELGGPALSISGRLVHRCARCGSPLSAPRAPCDRCAEELAPPSPAFAQEDAVSASPQAAPATTPGTPARGVRPHGVGAPSHETHTPTRVGAVPQALTAAPTQGRELGQDLADSIAPEPGMKAPGGPNTNAEELELVERAPRQETLWEDEAPRRSLRWKGPVVTLLVLAALGAGGTWVWTQRHALLAMLTSTASKRAPVLTIQSEPSGATVVVDGTTLGQTPLAVDNHYGDGPVPVQLRLKGYRTWTGTFEGSRQSSLRVKLER